MDFNAAQVTELVMSFGGKAVIFLLGLFATWIVAGWLQKLTQKSLRKAQVDMALQSFLGKMTRWLVIAAGVVACLGIFGIQTASFAAVLAATGFAVGMALQGTLGNFASGVMLLIFRPFKVDDVVNVGGTTGKVIEIDIFNTVLDTPDNRRIIVPNGAVFGNQIENVTFHNTRRVDVAVGSDYSADLDETRKVLTEAANSVENTLKDQAPAIVLTGLGASSVDWSVRVWVKTEDYWGVMDELTRKVKYALDKADIGIPYPQMDLHINGSDLSLNAQQQTH